MSKTIVLLKKYKPYNAQEEADKKFFIECEEKEQILTRDNTLAHLTSSAFITNPNRNKVLCIYHNIYKSWGWVGGHADGDDDMLYVAMKETREETSLKNFKVLSEEPIAIDSLSVYSHVRKKKFVNAHVHLNLTYLFEADEKETFHILEDENSNIGWLTFDELLDKCDEPHMLPVYKKIIERINKEYK